MVRALEREKHRFPEVIFPSQQQRPRLGPSLQMQASFLRETWGPALCGIGLSQAQAGELFGKWLLPLGSVFKETKVDEQAFRQRIQLFADAMARHLQDLKYFLHSPSWDPAVGRMMEASDPELTFLMRSGAAHVVTMDTGRPPDDASDEVQTTLYDVYLPNAETPGEARIRIVFPCPGAEQQADTIQVTNGVLQETHGKARQLLSQVAA
jgi:hypothetical protein